MSDEEHAESTAQYGQRITINMIRLKSELFYLILNRLCQNNNSGAFLTGAAHDPFIGR